MLTSNIRVYGIVQGVGFRPFVSRTCLENDIKGTVSNKGSYVEIFAQGDNVPALLGALKKCPPERAMILNIITKELDLPEFDTFEIIESEKDKGDIFVSPDIAICEKCKKELYDPGNRRYMHPFINCTNCGPRLTILDAMPYDRERTSMKDFKMCPECEYEYTHPETRRYDAQPVCCPDCGPEVYLLKKDEASGKLVSTEVRGRDAIIEARKAIVDGKICAIKGIGGYHLCCDAKNEEAVSRLRTLKNRPMKPFAVMMKDMDTVKRQCRIDSQETYDYLTGYQKPIVLLEKGDASELSYSVAPDNPKVGVMLPYTPVHMLLFDYYGDNSVSDCLVMTSANASGAPICRTDEDAINEISGFTDLVLSNNRTIRTRADDSVMDFYNGHPYMIRRSRGFAPLPIMLDRDVSGTVLAIGGELKNTFAIAKNSLIYPSAYVGDMADIRTVNALEESVKRMETLLEAKPEIVVADLHPRYNTTAVAESLGLPVLKIQHHYAHILSCMAENSYLDEVIGVSFDGTGYGTDGTIWGGEYLLCRTDGFERLGHIAPFIQVGGDLSSKEGWRIAASILGDLSEKSESEEKTAIKNNLSRDDICHGLGICSEMEYDLLGKMAERKVNSVMSTSAGRLFDAVSAVLGIRRSSTFEGEAATSLMFSAERYLKSSGVDLSLKPADLFRDSKINNVTDTNNLVKYLAGEKLSGQPADRLALMFHVMLAEMIAAKAIEYAEQTGVSTVALSGGVFQNTLLLKCVDDRLKGAGMRVLRHSLIPPNDGGIAAGQALAGLFHQR